MMELGRSCLGITQQLHAVEKASARRALMRDHSDRYPATAAPMTGEQRTRGEECKEITKSL